MKANESAKSERRGYTAKQREEILRDAESLGVCAAARKHGMPQPTISGWRRAEAANGGVVTAPEPAVAVGTDASASAARTTAKKTKGRRGARETTAPEPAVAVGTDESTSAARTTARKTKGTRGARRYTPSEKAEVLEYAAAHGVSAAHQKFGVSRFTIYEWQRKLAKAAKGEGPSPTSGPSPNEIEAQRDREILGEWRKHAGLGPSQVKNQLRRRGIKVGVATVRRVMEDAGYRPPKVKRDPHDERYESLRPNHRWHLDFVHRHIHRASTFTLILIDDCSRFVVGHGVDDAERAAMVIRTFEEAVARHGKPERVMHDRGAAFWSWRGISKFTALLEEMGIDQEVATEKELNGKVEVFNANLHKELFDVQRFYDVAEMKRRLAAHLHFYNHGRTHHALGGLLVPADRYYGRADEVLARIEAGAMRESDEPELRERALELFKVVSRNGAPEVWLLGQRLNVPLGT
jgi:putative transposase